jgi:hypothetical protein
MTLPLNERALDLLIVASPNDLVARSLERLCTRAGYFVQFADLETASRFFSITVKDGVAAIQPDIPLFLRIPPLKEKRDSFDQEFLHGECFVTLLAAASLCKSAVVNRPFRGSLGGRISQSASITASRVSISDVRSEIFSDTIPAPPERQSSEVWCVQDLGTFETAEWPAKPNGAGPYRAKLSSRETGYEVVTVLGPEAWRETTVDLDHLELQKRSADLVAKLQLTFAAVTWAITPTLSDATLVRVSAYPSLSQVAPVWSDLGASLLRVLFTKRVSVDDICNWT